MFAGEISDCGDSNSGDWRHSLLDCSSRTLESWTASSSEASSCSKTYKKQVKQSERPLSAHCSSKVCQWGMKVFLYRKTLTRQRTPHSCEKGCRTSLRAPYRDTRDETVQWHWQWSVTSKINPKDETALCVCVWSLDYLPRTAGEWKRQGSKCSEKWLKSQNACNWIVNKYSTFGSIWWIYITFIRVRLFDVKSSQHVLNDCVTTWKVNEFLENCKLILFWYPLRLNSRNVAEAKLIIWPCEPQYKSWCQD